MPGNGRKEWAARSLQGRTGRRKHHWVAREARHNGQEPQDGQGAEDTWGGRGWSSHRGYVSRVKAVFADRNSSFYLIRFPAPLAQVFAAQHPCWLHPLSL